VTSRRRMPRTTSSVDVILEEDAWKKIASDLVAQVEHATAVAIQRGGHRKDSFAVAILLTDDNHLRMLNLRHRGIDRPTNVLSFAASPGSGHLGDIAIAYGTAKREADAAGTPLLHHVLHLTVHGALHLLGYDHQEPGEADSMEALEAEILVEMKIPNPYRQHGCAA
jgi:probable rRNA maturation factor